MEILIIGILILLNGVFSMSEIALISSSKFKLARTAKKGHSGARKALALAESPNTFLSTVQIGITLIGILTGIYSGDKITDDLDRFVSQVGFLAPYSNTISVGLVVVILTYFSIVFGELLPKRIGLAFPEQVASLVATPMQLVSQITKPFIWLLAKSNDACLKILGITEKREGPASEEEIASIIHESTLYGEIEQIEQDIVKRVFALGNRKVSELMTHKSDLVWLDVNEDLETIRSKMQLEVHSAYPVANKDLDKIVGVLYVKELFPRDLDGKHFNLKSYLRKPLFVHEKLPAYQILEQFKSSRVHHAIVVDEYGSVEGMVTMDDIVDELVGDEAEPHDDELKIIARDENSWLVDGQYPYYELLEFLNIEDDTEVNFTTVGGLILHQLRSIPVEGEKTEWLDFELEVMDMDGQRIDKVMVTRKFSSQSSSQINPGKN
ncbi:hemolysin family protein [Arcticibacter sp.]|uniref:hemolysin family protein n=1 Tax=Arcticibacter sp. TaxID=1872630 RepID=UPI00388DBF40